MLKEYTLKVTVRVGGDDEEECDEKVGNTFADDESKKYDWANLTGNYNDPKDYKRMCKSCHLRYDWPKRRKPKIQNNEVERE